MLTLTIFTWKLVIIGDGSVGKTSLIHRCIDNKFQDSYNETIGIDLFNHTFTIDFEHQPHEISLLIYDLGGQEYWKKLRADFYNRSKGLVLVYDVSNTSSFQHLESWYNEAIENIGHPVPCIVIGKKNDLSNNNPSDLFESTFAKLNFKHFLASAKTGQSVLDAFKEISRDILAFEGSAK